MAIERQTTTQAFVVPGDDTGNTPWGRAVQLLSRAIDAVDALFANTPTKAQIQGGGLTYAVDTGSANAYAAAFTPAPTLAAGLTLMVKCVHANTGASTLAVNGGSAKAITKNGTTALAGAEISANQIVQVVYDGTQFQLISQ